MEILASQRQAGGGTVLLSRCFDVVSAHWLEELTGTWLDRGGTELVPDLSGLPHINSAGLQVLLVTAKHSQNHVGRNRLAGAHDEVRKVLKTSGFEALTPSYEKAGAAAEN